ncbi:MAG: DUF3108 domain-containing protein [candidate division Zixibacteria bacterium]|nr:DUF3108 domain-containing protein [candidate division Zixibacteria bacterium]
MVKTATLILTFILIFAAGIHLIDHQFGIASVQADSTVDEGSDGFDRYVENLAFGPGEKLYFDIGYGFINAGQATIEVADLIEYSERPCYHIISEANSNKFFSSFFKVEDRVESIVDGLGIFSWHFEKHVREGGYRADRLYKFDQKNNLVYYGEDTIEVAPFVQDALSVLYYVRTQELKIGESYYIENFTDGKKYPLEVMVHRKETIKVKAGKFDCIVVEPLFLTSGVFKHEGKLTVWLTDDRLKMPVLMKSKVLVGSISAELTDYELGEIIEF